jgi:hypothetical protein
MLGLVATVAFSLAVALGVRRRASKWLDGLDELEAWGLSGLAGLGLVGTAVLLPGLVPGGLRWALPLFVVLVCAGAALGPRPGFPKWRSPRGAEWLGVAGLAAVGLAGLVGVLAPSDARDWDTLAYHLAVPKIWLAAGSVVYVPAIHHSNFPFAVDNLYLFGLWWGGEPGAKAFSWMLSVFGLMAAFGLGRRKAGPGGGWLAALLVAGMPVVGWESGTAYIDVAHGLYSGLGTVYFAEALLGAGLSRAAVAGVCLGLALGTKHTGLAAFAAGAAVAGVMAWRVRLGVRPAAVALALAFALALPWYAKSAAMTGNPVYPFFYSVFGGREWDAWRARIYAEEQASFGPGKGLAKLGHSVLGLAYQPGRYVNPSQSEGGGFPTGALGGAVLAAGALAVAAGRLGRERRVVLALVGLQLLAWSALSQQSRYLVAVGLPLAVVAAGLDGRLRRAAFGLAGGQAAYSAWMLWVWQAGSLPVVLGTVPVHEARQARLAFAAPAEAIDNLPGKGKVALYDEVFGYLLDRPYIWANPGHSTRFGPEGMDSGSELVARYRQEGVEYVYLNVFTGMPDDLLERWMRAMGFFGPLARYTLDERAALRDDPNLWWRVLFADAVAEGHVRLLQQWNSGFGPPRALLFEVGRE